MTLTANTWMSGNYAAIFVLWFFILTDFDLFYNKHNLKKKRFAYFILKSKNSNEL